MVTDGFDAVDAVLDDPAALALELLHADRDSAVTTSATVTVGTVRGNGVSFLLGIRLSSTWRV
jgi:hypothetical protein